MTKRLYVVRSDIGASGGLRPFAGGPDVPFDPPPSTAWQPGIVLPEERTVDPVNGNAGLLAGYTKTTLPKVHTGDWTITTPGTDISNTWITGRLSIQAAGVTGHNFWVSGGPTQLATGSDWIHMNLGNGAVRDCVFEDFVVEASDPSVDSYGIKGHGATLRRFVVRYMSDGVSPQGNSLHLEGGIIDTINVWASDPRQKNGLSHSDGIQVAYGDDIIINGMRFKNMPINSTANVMVTQDVASTLGPVSNLKIINNWMDGCSNHINCYDKSGDPNRNAPPIQGLVISGNRHTHRTRLGVEVRVEAPTYDLNQPNVAVSGTYTDTGLPVNTTRGVLY